jgi:ABC-type transport system involved in multi-copper enzyme maturation permease subunit
LACNTIPECIEKIITFILWVAGAILPIIIIIAGFLFLTSGGDPEKVRTAKRMIFWAVVGLAIILLAKGIISLIKTVIGG